MKSLTIKCFLFRWLAPMLLISAMTLLESCSDARSCVAKAPLQMPVVASQNKILFGSMEADGRQFRFVIDVASATSAELTSWDEGNAKFTLDDFSMDDSKLQFKVKESRASYQGIRSDDQQPYTGDWKQAGVGFELKISVQHKKPVDVPLEIWTGLLQAGPQKLNLQIRGYQQDDGSIRYFFDSVSQRAGGFIGEGTREGDSIKLQFAAIGAKFKGKLSDDGNSIAGKFTQGQTFDLTMNRSTELMTSLPPNRPQVPQAPFPYQIKEVEFTSEQGKIKLAGTLTIPFKSRKYPLAILISGSGPQDRDETIFGHKPFLIIADQLTRNGIAVFRFDERGVGKSTGKFSGATSEDFAKDVAAAIAYAKTLPEIDSQKIGLIGHSEGGYIAPMIAAEDRSIAFVVMLAGPGVNGQQIKYSQVRLMAQAAGADEVKLKWIRAGQELIFTQMSNLKMGEKLSDRLSDRILEVFVSLKQQALVNDDQEQEIKVWIAANLKAMDDPWFQFFAKHEPAPVLERVKCPVLAINGAKDLQVDSQLNLPVIESALKKGGHQDFVIKELENLNHLFQTCSTGGIEEYGEIEETFEPAALFMIKDWIISKVGK